MEPEIGVITVCRNAEKVIAETMASVLAQVYSNYEYIFVDGASADDTLPVIQSRLPQFTDRGIPVRVVSEPDRGIYDAMNKGIRLARGKWVLMLNAGDTLADPLVLEDLFGRGAASGDVLYGDAWFRDFHRGRPVYKPFPAMPLARIDEGLPFCHQSAFVRRSILVRYPFETRFSISADYDQLLRAWLDGAAFCHAPRVVAVFDCTGLCLRRPEKTMAQCARIRKYRGYHPKRNLLGQAARYGKGLLRGTVKAKLPEVFYSPERGWITSLPRDAAGRVILP
jgi:glycosyltransferase involved in cell wall biosynthesis